MAVQKVGGEFSKLFRTIVLIEQFKGVVIISHDPRYSFKAPLF